MIQPPAPTPDAIEEQRLLRKFRQLPATHRRLVLLFIESCRRHTLASLPGNVIALHNADNSTPT